MTRPRTVRPYNPDPELAELEPREKLLFCARELFQQKSYAGVSIRDLVEATDLTQITIYYYFKNKDGLFLAVLTNLLQELDDEFQAALRQSHFQAQLKALARVFTRSPAPNLPLLFHDLQQRLQLGLKNPGQGISQQDARKAYLYVNQIWPRALENMLREGRRAGQVHAANPVFVAHYLLTLLTSYPHSPFNTLTAGAADQSVNALLEFLNSSLKTINTSAQI